MSELGSKESSRKVTLQPIAGQDIPRVSLFLNQELNSHIPASVWAQAIDQHWADDAPNHGFMLLAGEDVVGVQLAFYANRLIGGEVKRFCNLAAWCVLEPYRSQGLRLLTTMLAQKGYTFTDLSPSGSVVELNRRLKFQFLDTKSVLIPNLPWPGFGGGIRIETDKEAIAKLLGSAELQIFRDHAHAPAAHHLLVTDGQDHCYVLFRRDRRKRLPLFASILFVSNPHTFRKTARHIFRHLLMRHGILATIAECRIIGAKPAFSLELSKPRPKMFRSPDLEAGQIDNLYSELTSVPW